MGPPEREHYFTDKTQEPAESSRNQDGAAVLHLC